MQTIMRFNKGMEKMHHRGAAAASSAAVRAVGFVAIGLSSAFLLTLAGFALATLLG